MSSFSGASRKTTSLKRDADSPSANKKLSTVPIETTKIYSPNTSGAKTLVSIGVIRTGTRP
jgi:hypothetical protein